MKKISASSTYDIGINIIQMMFNNFHASSIRQDLNSIHMFFSSCKYELSKS